MASHDGNSFQWKVNVAIRSLAVFSCAAPGHGPGPDPDGGGAYPFAEKRSLSFLPPKIPAIFSKK